VIKVLKRWPPEKCKITWH